MSRFSRHIPILAYHRVGALRSDHVPTISADAFERQLVFLARHRYHVLALHDVVRVLEHQEPSPRHSLAITFDDGYEETRSIAWPLLKRFGYPATVFVTPAEVGLPGFATWEDVIELASDGMSIGSHTMHHSYLPFVREDRLAEELLGSKRVIETRIGRQVHFLSYPVGGFTPQAQAVARQAGYLAACTTNRAIRNALLDRYALRRIKVTERDANILRFFAKISGYYDMFRQPKDPS